MIDYRKQTSTVMLDPRACTHKPSWSPFDDLEQNNISFDGEVGDFDDVS